MFGVVRSYKLVRTALCGALVAGACMPERVEVGRDSTLDVSEAGEAGAVGTGAENGGSAGASDTSCGPEVTCPP